MRRLAGWVRRWYGARPLHLLALLAAFALAGYAVRGVVAAGQWRGFALWFAVAIVGHDLLLFPLYSLADLSLRRLLPGRSAGRRARRRGRAARPRGRPAPPSPALAPQTFLSPKRGSTTPDPPPPATPAQVGPARGTQARPARARTSPALVQPAPVQPTPAQPTPAQPTPVQPARRSSTTSGCPPPFRCCSCWSGSRSSSGCRRAPTIGPAAWSRALISADGWPLPGCCSPPRPRATRSHCAGPRPPLRQARRSRHLATSPDRRGNADEAQRASRHRHRRFH